MLNSLDWLDSCNDWLLFILARFQFALQIYSTIYIHICYYYMCMFIYAAKWIFPIDVVDRRRSFHWWRLCSGLNFQIFQLTCLHYICTQTQVHVCIRIFAYVCVNFSVRIVISCSLSGGRSVPIATLFVRVRADLQAPARGRCTWASRCCCRYYCRCCGCIGKPDQAPCTYRGNGPGCCFAITANEFCDMKRVYFDNVTKKCREKDREETESEGGRQSGCQRERSERDRSICFNRQFNTLIVVFKGSLTWRFSHTFVCIEMVSIPFYVTYASLKSKDPRIEYERIHCADSGTLTLMFATTRRDATMTRTAAADVASSRAAAWQIGWVASVARFAFGAGARVGIVREFLNALATVVGRTLAHLAVVDTRLLACSRIASPRAPPRPFGVRGALC